MQTSQRTTVAILVSLLIIMVLTMGVLLTYIDELGHNIPSHNLASDYLVAWTLAFGFGFLLFALPIRSELRMPMLVFWGARTIVTLVVMLFYESYYDLDAFTFYKEARNSVLEHGLVWGAGTDNVKFLMSVISEMLPLESTFHCLKVVWSFFGLLGVYFFYRGIVRATGKDNKSLLWILGLFPSIMFWSSHAHKDPLVFFGIGLYFYGAFPILQRFTLRSLFAVILGIFICGSIRFWVAPIFLMPLIAVLVIRSRTHILWRTGILGGLFYAQMVLIQIVMDRFTFTTKLDVIALANNLSHGWAVGGSGQEVPQFHSAADLGRFLPLAIFTSLFRPFPGEVMNAFGLLAGLENAFLLVIVTWGLFKAGPYIFRSSTMLMTILTIFFWSLIYCFVSYQNLGTAVRFKLQVLPLLLMIPYIATIESQLHSTTPPVHPDSPK